MLIALLCESEMKLADDTIELILDKVSCHYYCAQPLRDKQVHICLVKIIKCSTETFHIKMSLEVLTSLGLTKQMHYVAI